MFRFIPVLLCVVLVASCAPPVKPKPERTQLEIREFQTRTFEVEDVKLVMKSILNTLQDDSFIVKNVALDLGFLTATKEIDVEDQSARFWSQFARANDARYVKNEVIEATVNVSEFGKKVRVRVNFQSKVLDNKGAIVSIDQIIDEQFYKEFFAKVDKGVFLQQQEI